METIPGRKVLKSKAGGGACRPVLMHLFEKPDQSAPEATLFSLSGTHISVGVQEQSSSSAGRPAVQPVPPVLRFISPVANINNYQQEQN